MGLKKIGALNEFAKSAAFKEAKPDDLFVIVRKSANLGKSADGNILLNKDAEIVEIRKDEMESAGYGNDAMDDTSPAESGLTREDGAEMAKSMHRHKGMLTKAYGLTDDEIEGDENDDQETNDMPGSASGEVIADKSVRARGRNAITKRGLDATLETFGTGLLKKLDDKLEAGFAAIQAAKPGEQAPLAKRNETPGAPIVKTAISLAGETTETKGDIEKANERVKSLETERKALAAKVQKGMKLDNEEILRADNISQEYGFAVENYNGLLTGKYSKFEEFVSS